MDYELLNEMLDNDNREFEAECDAIEAEAEAEANSIVGIKGDNIGTLDYIYFMQNQYRTAHTYIGIGLAGRATIYNNFFLYYWWDTQI